MTEVSVAFNMITLFLELNYNVMRELVFLLISLFNLFNIHIFLPFFVLQFVPGVAAAQNVHTSHQNSLI